MLKQSIGQTFSQVLVTGEMIDPLISQRGHLYFRLADQNAELKVVMWSRDVQRLRSKPTSGDMVTVRGSLDVYAQRGDLQLVASALLQSGRGEKLLALARLKEQLKKEGLFDRPRRPLPPIPKRVGVVTSVGSAVIHDIYQSIRKRFPVCEIICSPASVSGAMAPKEIVLALERLVGRADVVIVARGGGSFEELLPFSDEQLVRTAANYPLPLVAAVGHGSDQTLLDLVADHTAPTPTAAAVLVTPVYDELIFNVNRLRARLTRAIGQTLTQHRRLLVQYLHRYQRSHPRVRLEAGRRTLVHFHGRLLSHTKNRLTRDRQTVDALSRRLTQTKIRFTIGRQTLDNLTRRLFYTENRLTRDRQLLDNLTRRLAHTRTRLTRDRQTVDNLTRRLHTQGPKQLLARGFALVTHNGKVVTRATGRSPGDELELRFADGIVAAEIRRVETT